MKSSDIRRAFLDYFRENGHAVVASSALIPANDPTLYFTNAGMVQFKDTFLGKERRDYSTAATSQKCLRVSGKHNDLEVVGRTARHHTFFEMLGNFSFGDYFKADAIRHAWQLLTVRLGVPADRLWVTVFEDDDEAEQLWQQVAGVPKERIQRLGAKDNFWSMGDTGPCGPCSEIFYDHGEQYGPPGGPATESDRYIEIWNLVFMQFERDASGSLTPLPRPSIDTGMGLERIAAVLQGVYANWDTDTFQDIIGRAAARAGVRYGADPETDVALRVIADHSRATAFLMADGVMPSNTERGYVLRRIMRRAIRFGVKIGLDDAFLPETVAAVIDEMGPAYPELSARRSFILDVTASEEARFRRTLSRGLALLDKAFASLPDAAAPLPGQVAFELFDTYGFPVDLTRLIAEERGHAVDLAAFQRLLDEARDLSRQRHRGSGAAAIAADVYALAERFQTAFLGHEKDRHDGAEVLALLDAAGAEVGELSAGESGSIVVDASPFYAEGGGQVGDSGQILADAAGLVVEIADTHKPTGSLFLHRGAVAQGRIAVGDTVSLQVDAPRRDRTRLNHTATHLLHAALRTVLGDHVMQKGSLVQPDRLRFDFSHPKAMGREELQQVEDLVYGEILRNTALSTEVMGIDAAMARGAMALFGEKYGAEVRVIAIPGFSIELCGGTHARATGDIGLFRITSEAGVAAGVRRIEAVTGIGALRHQRSRDEALLHAAALLKTPPETVPDSIERLLEERRRLDREVDRLKADLARQQAGDLLHQARTANGVQILAARMDADAATLRTEAERLRDALGGPAVVVLASAEGADAVKLVAMVSKDIAGKTFHAGNIIREVARIVGGSGGGRPDMAQAGGRDPSRIDEALQLVYTLTGT